MKSPIMMDRDDVVLLVNGMYMTIPTLERELSEKNERLTRLQARLGLLLSAVEDRERDVKHDYSTCEAGQDINADRGCWLCDMRKAVRQ